MYNHNDHFFSFLECTHRNNGYTRDIHYLLIQKALGTRSRLSNFVLGLSEFCKVCPGLRENIPHVFVDCKRAQDAWDRLERLEPIWQGIIGRHLEFSVKIFGETEMKDKYLSRLANVLVHVMQRTIWQTRKIYEEKGIQKDLWKYFKWKFSLILNRAYLFFGESFFRKEVSEVLPVHLVSNRMVCDI